MSNRQSDTNTSNKKFQLDNDAPFHIGSNTNVNVSRNCIVRKIDNTPYLPIDKYVQTMQCVCEALLNNVSPVHYTMSTLFDSALSILRGMPVSAEFLECLNQYNSQMMSTDTSKCPFTALIRFLGSNKKQHDVKALLPFTEDTQWNVFNDKHTQQIQMFMALYVKHLCGCWNTDVCSDSRVKSLQVLGKCISSIKKNYIPMSTNTLTAIKIEQKAVLKSLVFYMSQRDYLQLSFCRKCILLQNLVDTIEAPHAQPESCLNEVLIIKSVYHLINCFTKFAPKIRTVHVIVSCEIPVFHTKWWINTLNVLNTFLKTDNPPHSAWKYYPLLTMCDQKFPSIKTFHSMLLALKDILQSSINHPLIQECFETFLDEHLETFKTIIDTHLNVSHTSLKIEQVLEYYLEIVHRNQFARRALYNIPENSSCSTYTQLIQTTVLDNAYFTKLNVLYTQTVLSKIERVGLSLITELQDLQWDLGMTEPTLELDCPPHIPQHMCHMKRFMLEPKSLQHLLSVGTPTLSEIETLEERWKEHVELLHTKVNELSQIRHQRKAQLDAMEYEVNAWCIFLNVPKWMLSSQKDVQKNEGSYSLTTLQQEETLLNNVREKGKVFWHCVCQHIEQFHAIWGDYLPSENSLLLPLEKIAYCCASKQIDPRNHYPTHGLTIESLSEVISRLIFWEGNWKNPKKCVVCLEYHPLNLNYSQDDDDVCCESVKDVCLTCYGQLILKGIREPHEHIRANGMKCVLNSCDNHVPVKVLKHLFLNTEQFERYSQFRLRAVIDSNASAKWCPTPNCTMKDSFPSWINTSITHQCQQCQHSICETCFEPVHDEETCEEAEARRTQHFLDTDQRRCPNRECRVRIHRTGGCLHMTCKQCTTDFCYACGRQWYTRGDTDVDDSEHFTSRCNSMQCFYTNYTYDDDEDDY